MALRLLQVIDTHRRRPASTGPVGGMRGPIEGHQRTMSTFFPALQNSLLSRLLFVSVLLFLATIAVMMTVSSGSSAESARGSASEIRAPLFITGGTSAPANGSVTQ